MNVGRHRALCEQGLVLAATLAGAGILYGGLCFAADQIDRILARRELMVAWRARGRWHW